MNKLNNQRKITHLAPKNPMKTDLMTENIHTRKLYEQGELQKMKVIWTKFIITWPMIQTSPNLVPRVFSLSNKPPPSWKARRPWGRGCTKCHCSSHAIFDSMLFVQSKDLSRGVSRIFQRGVAEPTHQITIRGSPTIYGLYRCSPSCISGLSRIIAAWRPILTKDKSRWRKYFTKKTNFKKVGFWTMAFTAKIL